jgi:hypothetical protein
MPNLLRTLIAAGILSVAAQNASAKIERTVERTFPVQPGTHLVVSTFGGNISLRASPGPQVRVVAKETIRASSDAEADKVLENLELVIRQDGGTVTASATYPSSVGFHFGEWPPVGVDFVIEVPVNASAELKTSGGNEDVEALDGELHARTSGGNIRLGHLGGAVDAETSGGNISLDEGRAAARLMTSGGNVRAGKIGGPADIRTSGGDITLDSLTGAVHASTSGGDVRAVIDGPLTGDCSLSTSGGQVRATVGRTASFRLDASTSGGGVRLSDVTITVDHGRVGSDDVVGTVNGGGPTLKLRSSGGDIAVLGR